MRNSGATAYVVTYEDGTTEVVSNVTNYSTDAHFVTFSTSNDDSYTNRTVKAVATRFVRSVVQVENPEVTVTPKYTYLITLANGSSKTVEADLYRVAVHGQGTNSPVQVIEFFTRVDGSTREELTIPFASVEMVERVTDSPIVPQQGSQENLTDESASASA